MAQRGYLLSQVVLFDDDGRPHELDQLAASDHPFSPFDQGREHIECTRTQGHRFAIDLEAALRRPQFEAAEAVRRVGHAGPGAPSLTQARITAFHTRFIAQKVLAKDTCLTPAAALDIDHRRTDMTRNINETRVQVDEASFLRLKGAKGHAVICLEGSLWVTP